MAGSEKKQVVAARPVNVPMLGSVLAGRYRLESILGRGASAFVFRARDELLRHMVALKVLLPQGILTSEMARDMRLGLREEALTAMQITHPNVLRVFNYERDGEWEFLVMELLDGDELSTLCRRRPGNRLADEETARIGMGCLQALAEVHAQGVVHNDVKPGNLFLTRSGGLKLCDFGLARRNASRDPRYRGLAAGTPAFMSPELIRGARGEPRSDLYSLAATLYAVGNGEPPFGAGKPALALHCNTEPPPSRHLHPSIDRVLRVALAKQPEDRYESAVAMAEALSEALSEISVALADLLEIDPDDVLPADEVLSVALVEPSTAS